MFLLKHYLLLQSKLYTVDLGSPTETMITEAFESGLEYRIVCDDNPGYIAFTYSMFWKCRSVQYILEV